MINLVLFIVGLLIGLLIGYYIGKKQYAGIIMVDEIYRRQLNDMTERLYELEMGLQDDDGDDEWETMRRRRKTL
jgi:uncharacterized protein YebE (UPF0316 family)